MYGAPAWAPADAPAAPGKEVELLDYWRSQQGANQQGVKYESLQRLQELAGRGSAAGLKPESQQEKPRAAPPVWSTFSDTDLDHLDDGDRVPFWKQDESYSERGRQWRRTVFMHDDWVRHRSSNRFVRNMRTLGSSGINQALSKELTFVTLDAVFVVLINALFAGYQDFSGVVHPGPLHMPALMLPALPFTILMPALSLLLVFRTNTGYARWNEVRELNAVILTLQLTVTRLAPWGLQPIQVPGCNPMHPGCNPMHPGCNPMHPGANAMGRPHQQLPQRGAPERHESPPP